MAGTKGHRAWGNIKRQKTRVPSYQASYIGPDLRRYYAPLRFTSRMNAERWLAKEREYKEDCLLSGETWKSPQERSTEKKAKALTLGEYGEQVLAQKAGSGKLAPRTQILYEALWSQAVEPKLGRLALRDVSVTVVNAWHAGLNSKTPRRNSQAYGLLSMVCNNAVREDLLTRNPCQIAGAANVKPKKVVRVPSITEVHAIADKLGAAEGREQFKALVLLAAWCGLRYGEVSELRRKDFDADCSTLSVTRAVGHRQGKCLIGSTKTGEHRTVAIPEHIQADVLSHLERFVGKDAEALLFTPSRGGCHLNERVFNKDIFQPAANAAGRQDLSAHDLRRFAGTVNARVATLAENMLRLGHKTVDASMRYQHSISGRDAAVAAALSDLAREELKANPVH